MQEGIARDSHKDLTEVIIGAAIEVHRGLGPGLLESVYESCLAHELLQQGIAFRRQVALPVRYKDHLVDGGLVIDLLVEDAVIVELKAVERLAQIHDAQLLTYLKLSGVHLGLLINFNTKLLKDGIRRLIL